MPGGARVVLVVVGRAALASHRRVLVKKRARQSHRDHVHCHGVAQQAPQDQEHDQHKRQTSAHGPNDIGAAKEVPSTKIVLARTPWNKDKIGGQKALLKPKNIWSICVRIANTASHQRTGFFQPWF